MVTLIRPSCVVVLSEPAPATDVEIGKHLNVLAAQSSPLEEWPTPGSALDESLMACSVFSFLNPRQAEDCRAQLRRLLGKEGEPFHVIGRTERSGTRSVRLV